MDKLHEESRKQFEEFYREEYLRGEEALTRSPVTGSYIYAHAQGHWKSWIRSRQSIVVELPEPHAHLIWLQAGYAPDDYWDDVEVSRSEKDKCCDGSDRYPVYAEHEIAEALRSIGLSIKGE